MFNIPRERAPNAAIQTDARPSAYSFPTEKNSRFAQAMSSVACNPSLAAQGMGSNNILSGSELDEQLRLLLAVKMGFDSSDQINKRALNKLRLSKSHRADLKQVLRARAGVYEEELPPSLFKRNVDLGGRASGLAEKSQARNMLVGAPLFLAQLCASELRSFLESGDKRVLSTLRLNDVMTVREFFQAIGRAPPVNIISLYDVLKGSGIQQGITQIEGDLDYVQEILISAGKHEELNPLLNAILDGIKRRASVESFLQANGCLDLDRMRHTNSITVRDCNRKAKEFEELESLARPSKGSQRQTNYSIHRRSRPTTIGICYAFQRGKCDFFRCRFTHACLQCGVVGHGSRDCPESSNRS